MIRKCLYKNKNKQKKKTLEIDEMKSQATLQHFLHSVDKIGICNFYKIQTRKMVS